MLTERQEEDDEGSVESLEDVDPEAPWFVARSLRSNIVQTWGGGEKLGAGILVKHSNSKLQGNC